MEILLKSGVNSHDSFDDYRYLFLKLMRLFTCKVLLLAKDSDTTLVSRIHFLKNEQVIDYMKQKCLS